MIRVRAAGQFFDDPARCMACTERATRVIVMERDSIASLRPKSGEFVAKSKLTFAVCDGCRGLLRADLA